MGASVDFLVIPVYSCDGVSIRLCYCNEANSHAFNHDKIVAFASCLLLIAGIGVFIMQESVWFFIPMVFVSLSHLLLALPNLLQWRF
ncbi:hypothetical protein OK016_30160 [Vibrio chagasii]|nr:hypothetical protein [Vibrio chagasii]